MRTKIFLTFILLFLPMLAGAQNASEQDNGILSSLPEIEIDSTENYNNSTGQNTSSQTNLSWIIILGLVFLGVILYSFDIDPKWIITLIAVIAVIYALISLDLLPI